MPSIPTEQVVAGIRYTRCTLNWALSARSVVTWRVANRWSPRLYRTVRLAHWQNVRSVCAGRSVVGEPERTYGPIVTAMPPQVHFRPVPILCRSSQCHAITGFCTQTMLFGESQVWTDSRCLGEWQIIRWILQVVINTNLPLSWIGLRNLKKDTFPQKHFQIHTPFIADLKIMRIFTLDIKHKTTLKWKNSC